MHLENLEKISFEEVRWLVYFLTVGSIASVHRGIGYLGLFLLIMLLVTVMTVCSRSKNPRIRRGFAFGMVAGAILLSLSHIFLFAQPAHAIFAALKDFMAEALPESAPMINTIFDMITLMLLAYFAIAMVGIVSSIMNGQPFVTAIQTPAMVIIVVTVTDVLTGILLGQ